jgi:hypothetical protein
MVEGEKLGLVVSFSCQNIEWSLPDESNSRRYEFWASKRLCMMQNLRQRILATPKQVSELKTILVEKNRKKFRNDQD